MESTEKKPFNKFAKKTIWTTIGWITFGLQASFMADPYWGISIGDGSSSIEEIVIGFFFWSFIALLFLTPIFGIKALVQTYKNGERGRMVALLLIVIWVLYISFRLYFIF